MLATQNCRYGIRRPKAIVFACGDGNWLVNRLRWSRWGGRVAIGTGIERQKSCDPSCAAGRIVSQPVTVRLYRRRACAGRTHLYYRSATLVYNSGRRAAVSVPCPY